MICFKGLIVKDSESQVVTMSLSTLAWAALSPYIMFLSGPALSH